MPSVETAVTKNVREFLTDKGLDVKQVEIAGDGYKDPFFFRIFLQKSLTIRLVINQAVMEEELWCMYMNRCSY